MALIKSVAKDSPAFKAGIRPGETLRLINGHEIRDVLDFMYYSSSPALLLELQNTKGRKRNVKLKNPKFEPLGLEFDAFLLDKPRSCANNCVFCFIDQLPRGLRKTLYFKDDDMRLSFLQGNYITLTNLSEREITRIIELKISPVNISVHATGAELRCKMLRNPKAGSCLDIMRRLSDGGITMNCQIVVLPDINDGAHLLSTMSDLYALCPAVNSVSVVPVGLTAHREGLFPLVPVDSARAANIIDMVDGFGSSCKRECGSRVFFCADELYLKAEREIPEYDYYEGFPQYENGVGMLRALEEEFVLALKALETSPVSSFSVATGEASEKLLKKLLQIMREKCYNVEGRVYAVKNRFFGGGVNVSGLVTGGDLIFALKGRELGDYLLIPASMLRHEGDLFLDDVSLREVQDELQIPVYPVANSGAALLNAFSAFCT